MDSSQQARPAAPAIPRLHPIQSLPPSHSPQIHSRDVLSSSPSPPPQSGPYLKTSDSTLDAPPLILVSKLFSHPQSVLEELCWKKCAGRRSSPSRRQQNETRPHRHSRSRQNHPRLRNLLASEKIRLQRRTRHRSRAPIPIPCQRRHHSRRPALDSPRPNRRGP